MLRTIAFVVLLSGCTCEAPIAEPEPAPTVTPTPTPPAPAPSTEETPPSPPAPAAARAWLARLREARRALHAGEHAAALTAFHALLEERPGSPRLRCEAGFVALRGGTLDEAEQLITTALRTWPRPIADDDRIPYAMCLYNRGLVARDRGQLDVAADAWRRSLELRSNRTVEAALAALEVPAPAPEADDDCSAAEWVRQRTEELSAETTVRDVEGAGWTATVATFEYPEDPDEENGAACTTTEIYMHRGDACADPLSVESSECRYYSYFDDHASLGDVVLEDGGSLGPVVTATVARYGRGDAEDGSGIDEYGSTTLYVCAFVGEGDHRVWECIDLVVESFSTTDCMGSGGCDDPDDDSDDELGLPEQRDEGYTLRWSIEDGALVITSVDEEMDMPDGVTLGRTPLSELF